MVSNHFFNYKKNIPNCNVIIKNYKKDPSEQQDGGAVAVKTNNKTPEERASYGGKWVLSTPFF